MAIAIDEVPRASLLIEPNIDYHILADRWRIHDAFQTNLTTAAADDLGIATGTIGTNIPYVISRDLNAAGALTGYARALFALPAELVSGQVFAIRATGGMITSTASVSATVDFEVYLHNGVTGITGSDLVTTAATSINSLTFGGKDFFLNSTGLAPGDMLDVRMALITNSVTASAHFAAVSKVAFRLPIRG